MNSRRRSRAHSITSSARASSGRWHGASQFLCGLEIDHQFVLGRRLHRKISRLLAIEDAIDISGRAPILVDKIGSIGDQAASDGERAFEVDRGQLVLGSKCDDQTAINRRQSARRHDQTAIRGAREGRNGALYLPDTARVDRVYLQPERRRHGLYDSKLTGSGALG